MHAMCTYFLNLSAVFVCSVKNVQFIRSYVMLGYFSEEIFSGSFFPISR